MPPEHCWTLGLVENLTPVGTNQIIKHIDGFLKFDSKNHKSVEGDGGWGSYMSKHRNDISMKLTHILAIQQTF